MDPSAVSTLLCIYFFKPMLWNVYFFIVCHVFFWLLFDIVVFLSFDTVEIKWTLNHKTIFKYGMAAILDMVAILM